MTISVEGGAEVHTGRRCSRCEAVSEDRYCACCGNELDRTHDLSTKQFLKEALIAVTDVNSALIASFVSLVRRPGELTAEYLRGDRTRFLPPFRLFLLCNVIYFIAAAQLQIGVLTVPFHTQTDQMAYANVSRGMVNEHLHMTAPAMTLDARATRDSIVNAFALKYDGATVGIGKVIVAVLIPMFALVFQILYIGRRRFFAEHLTLATHLVSFLLLAIAVIALAAAGAHYLIGPGNRQPVFDAIFIAAFGLYVYLAQRVVYDTNRGGAVLRTVLFAASLVPILVAIKFVLFVVTLHWVG